MNPHTDTASRPDRQQQTTAEATRQKAHLRLAIMKAAAAEGRRRQQDEGQREPLRDLWRQTR